MAAYQQVQTDPLLGALLLGEVPGCTSTRAGCCPTAMNDFESSRKNGHESTEIEPRTRRALERAYSVLHTDGTPIGDDEEPTVVAVVSGNSGRTHDVDVREERCTCEDHQYREAECAHLRRAKIALGRRPVPSATLQAVDVDEQLAANAPDPVVVTSDGGVLGADDGETTSTDADERPDDCDCGDWKNGLGLPCWPCYRDGVEKLASGGE